MIVALLGRKGHGKDAVGDAFEAEGFQREMFAMPLKEGAKLMLSLTDEQVYGSLDVKERVDPRYGVTPRHILQTLGTEWGRNLIHPDIWVLSCLSRVEQLPGDWVITDCRFQNEAKMVQERGGFILKVERPRVMNTLGSDHASEIEIDTIEPDLTIVNNGTLEDLGEAVRGVISRLRSGGIGYPYVVCSRQ